ncbi:MAG: histidine kinase [Bacteroidia bacterium]
MTHKNWIWYTVLGVFYLGLGWITYQFQHNVSTIETQQIDESLEADFKGSDWVSWEHTGRGVYAKTVHPLPSYKGNVYRGIQAGDRLLELDYNPITQPEVADRITAAARPGHPFVAIIQPNDPYSPSGNGVQAFFSNGFYLTFTFNHTPLYWHAIVWIIGFGAFVALVMLAILFPILRSNWKENFPLTGVVFGALLFFIVRLLRHLYLIIESDLTSVGYEKVHILLYCIMLFLYIVSYFHFKAKFKLYFLIPSILSGGYILFNVYQIIFVAHHLKYYHELIEDYTALFFLVHTIGALALFLTSKQKQGSSSGVSGLIGVILLSLLGILYFSIDGSEQLLDREHIFFGYSLLLFFPLVNATLLQLQFGKVSLVITRTIQYLVFFIFSIVLYLVITQLFNYLPGIQYRRILEFISFILLMLVFYLILKANQDRLSKYFVTAQQERLNKFKSFIAQIPQYTSSVNLRTDLVEKMMDFFNASTVHLWWNADHAENEAEERYYNTNVDIFKQLEQNKTVWSQSKEIAAFRLDDKTEEQLQALPYSLISPIKVDAERHALLMLGKKRRGVYNLSDLELISQLVQQAQLTLNILQLYAREKDLIQQTYEANLTALRSQINPHFLFNTLNSIGELVHESAEMAEQAVEKLAYIFRYTLNKSSQNYVALSEEMNLISTYLDLEKIRFGDRLNVNIEVAPEIKETQIPAFILMTLTENCIKHGIAKILRDGQVSLACFKEGDELVCEVYDNGPGIDLSRLYKSTGLSNSIARLENIYDRKNLLHFENTGDGTMVKMRIPLKKPE